VQRSRAKISFYTSPRERGLITQRIRAQTKKRTGQNRSKTFQLCVKPTWSKSQGSREVTHRRHACLGPAKVRVRLHQSAQTAPSCVSCLLLTCQKWFTKLRPGSMHLNIGLRSFCTFHEGRKHFTRAPSSLPIKGGSLLLIYNNTQEHKSNTKQEQEHLHSMGLSPS
jgi:hypothetical protein